ncbi:Outer membrane receptor protein, mostly Fe transport [Alloalcanivorax dieselolei B5]|uniref:Outer membrane receptor protein, mostly Fe transport n=1 Tax=Alcanivorax dieselolei (strain DSM 16502 / CGMCC 1.3690 / MCCC 1A00001 / B-5) TaxID=930169 RepID=K0CAF2_ALCDB|nr:TonB-dependent receptor [Alloalcanivorax dieselolei]AFT68416.1 Outer membrane receptor protein, mostly Fe transport [Alloalcanivorax dieselolei B5]GGJ99836.1 TonB-dependent receptor [Alloalcanivorax dieselolei]
MHHRLLWPVSAIGLALVCPAYGAEQTQDHVLEPVVVSASRTGATEHDTPEVIRVIKKEEIEEQRQITSDSSQILSNLLPSFSPSRQKMSGSGETLRGRTPLVMIDGIPQSNPLRPTGREMHTIDFAMVERIEVIQGANATNGLGATGGVINLITKRPEPGSLNQNIDVQVTTPTSELKSETLSYKTHYGVSGNAGNVDYLFSLGYEEQGMFLDGDNHLIGVDNTQGDLMNSRSYDAMGKLAYWLDDNQRLQLSVNRYRIKGLNEYVSVSGKRDKGVPTTSTPGTPEGDAPYNEVWTTGLSYDHYNLAGMQLNALAFYQDYESLFGATDSNSFQDPAIVPAPGRLYDQTMAETTKYGTKVSLTKDGLWNGRLKLTGGFDTLFDNTEQYLWQTNRTYVPEVEYTNLSPFIQIELKPIDSLTISAGARYEYAELNIDSYTTVAARNSVHVEGGDPSFNETLYNVGLVWAPQDNWNLFANYSEGFSIPDVGRALRGIEEEGQSVDDFDNLRPIVTDNIEGGVRYTDGPFSAEVSYYVSSSDYGSRVERENDAFVMRREKTKIDGIEGTLGYQFTPKHSGKLAYSHMRGRYDSNDDGTLDARLNGLNVAPDRLITSWSARWSSKLSSFVQANYAFDKNFDKSVKGDDMDFDGYLLVDAAIGYQLPKGQLSVALSNLLNKQYVTYYSQSALANNDRYFTGRGRTLTVGYRLNF